MLYLILAILSSALVSIFMRIGESHIKNQMSMFMANYAVCVILSLLFMNIDASILHVDVVAIVLGVVSGVLYLGSFMLLKYNITHNGVVLSSTFMKLGVLIPTIMAVVVFHETLKVTQAIGIVLSILAIIMIHFEKEAISQGNKKGWLILLLIGGGITDAMANIYEQVGMGSGNDMYLVITFLVAFLLAFIFSLKGKEKATKSDLFYGMLIGIPNYFSARFLLFALTQVDAVLVYPVYSIATLIMISLVGIIVFHEAISKKKLLALIIIIIALGLLNI